MTRLNKYLSIAANLGILAGLVLVLLQMRQNEALLRITLLNQYNDSYIATETAVAGESLAEIWAKSFENPTELTLAEMRAMEAQTFAPVLRWSSLYRLQQAGIIDDSVWRSEIDSDAFFYFSSPYTRAWWETNSPQLHSSVLPPGVRAYVDKRLNAATGTVWDNFKEIQERIGRSEPPVPVIRKRRSPG